MKRDLSPANADACGLIGVDEDTASAADNTFASAADSMDLQEGGAQLSPAQSTSSQLPADTQKRVHPAAMNSSGGLLNTADMVVGSGLVADAPRGGAEAPAGRKAYPYDTTTHFNFRKGHKYEIFWLLTAARHKEFY